VGFWFIWVVLNSDPISHIKMAGSLQNQRQQLLGIIEEEEQEKLQKQKEETEGNNNNNNNNKSDMAPTAGNSIHRSGSRPQLDVSKAEIQGNVEEKYPTILLPNQSDDLSHLALDIGGIIYSAYLLQFMFHDFWYVR